MYLSSLTLVRDRLCHRSECCNMRLNTFFVYVSAVIACRNFPNKNKEDTILAKEHGTGMLVRWDKSSIENFVCAYKTNCKNRITALNHIRLSTLKETMSLIEDSQEMIRILDENEEPHIIFTDHTGPWPKLQCKSYENIIDNIFNALFGRNGFTVRYFTNLLESGINDIISVKHILEYLEVISKYNLMNITEGCFYYDYKILDSWIDICKKDEINDKEIWDIFKWVRKI